jgi:excisionase family DNA binding protein
MEKKFFSNTENREEAQTILTAFEKWIDRMITNAVEKALNASQPTAEEPIWLSSAQVCKRLDIDRSTLWRWSKEGYLPGTKFGNRVRYKLSDVERVEAAEK